MIAYQIKANSKHICTADTRTDLIKTWGKETGSPCTMTVGELVAELSKVDPATPIALNIGVSTDIFIPLLPEFLDQKLNK